MEKLVIIDGHHLLFKMFYGIPNKILNKQGTVVNGVLGFSAVLFKLLNHIKPDHVFVVFDSEQELDRSQQNQEYKANRPDLSDVEEVDNPFSQIPLIEKVLNHINVSYMFSADGLEADDLIANLCHKNKDKQKYILSGDTDFLQLVDASTTVLNYQNKEFLVYDTNKVYEKFGVYPRDYALYKSLVGDTADNIRGVEKIGKVTAAKIVNTYNNIDSIFENLDKFSNTIAENLANSKFQVISNYQIIDLSQPSKKIINFPNTKLNYDYETNNSRDILKILEIF